VRRRDGIEAARREVENAGREALAPPVEEIETALSKERSGRGRNKRQYGKEQNANGGERDSYFLAPCPLQFRA
jgi:hypothetical protein